MTRVIGPNLIAGKTDQNPWLFKKAIYPVHSSNPIVSLQPSKKERINDEDA